MANNFHGPRYFVDAKENIQYVITFSMGRPAEMVALDSKTGMPIPPQVLFSGDNKDKSFTAVDDETLEVFSIKTQNVPGMGLGISVEPTGQNVDKLPDQHPTGADAARRFDDTRKQQAERLKDMFGGLFGGGDKDPDESPFGGLGDLFGNGEDNDDNWTPPKREPVQDTTPRGRTKPGIKGVPSGGYKVSDSALEKVLHKFGTDLTEQAMKGELDPVVGRDEELSQLKQFLLRKNKSSVNILGEAGTGKTAMFDALAQDIVAGKAEEELADARVISLDITGMNATDQAKFRGQFEKELKKVLDGLEERGGYINGQKVILCLDEIHSILGAGAVSGNEGGGAAQIMKPFLARGSITCIGTTTLKEHKKYIEKDGALNRRFQPLYLDETDTDATLFILSKVNEHYGKYHGMDTLMNEDQMKKVVKMTDRFMPAQYQPDKSIGVLDDAMAIARKEGRKGVTDDDIITAVSKASKLDKKFLNQDDHQRFIALEEQLPQIVLGQDEQLEAVGDRLMSARAGLTDPNQPWGAFLFLGPTGVGKTETCYALGELLHGDRDSVIRIDMSKYSEKHAISGLIGSPPGYVGHEDTEGEFEKVREKPYSIVVLDEVEKAHPDVFNVLLPILQDGEIEDSRGRKISFKNTIIVMTSNLGAGKSGKTIGHIANNDVEEDRKLTYMAAAKSQFRPELINRINMLGGVQVFNRLDKPVIDKLVKREVEKVGARLQDASGGGLQLENITLKVSDEVLAILGEKGNQPEYGARPLQAEVQRNLAQPLGRWLMKGKSEYNSKIAAGEEVSDELKAIFDKRSKAEIFIDETGKTMTPKIKVIELAKEEEPVLETVGADDEPAVEEKTTPAQHVEKKDKPDTGKIDIPVKSNDNDKAQDVPIKTKPPRIRPRSNGGPKK
jgi:ATP-dependent Clp protease ATP-binding subunit ClpC